MNTTNIICVSQFISIVKRDLGLSIAPEDVRLGRLEFFGAATLQKDSGYVCFYAYVDGNLVYVKAYQGKTERTAKQVSMKLSNSKMEFFVGHSFLAIDNSLWFYVKSGDDKEIISERAYLERKRFADALKASV